MSPKDTAPSPSRLGQAKVPEMGGFDFNQLPQAVVPYQSQPNGWTPSPFSGGGQSYGDIEHEFIATPVGFNATAANKGGCGDEHDALLTEGELAETEYILLAKLYCFGERMQDPHFRDAVIDAIVARVNDLHKYVNNDGTISDFQYYPTTPAINIIYEGTPPSSPARRLMVNIYSSRGMSEWMTDEVHVDFTLDLARKFCDLNVAHQSLVDLLVSDNCEFHGHGEREECRFKESRKRKWSDIWE